MDASDNGRYARAPELKDLLALCQALNQQNVRYILIGGFAVILQGFVRGTKDIDILVDPSSENISRVKQALSYLPDNAISSLVDDEVKKYEVVKIADEIVIDLMSKACGIDYATASQNIEYRCVEGVTIPIAKKELLIRMKQTLRPSDKMDVEFLTYRLEEEKQKP